MLLQNPILEISHCDLFFGYTTSSAISCIA
ncbi:hypothetical protein Gotur_014725 [Gossypium turneri]